MELSKQALIKKITEKKAYQGLPMKDVELCFAKYDKPTNTDSEKVKKTRNMLRKMYAAFSSQRLVKRKELTPSQVMKYHRSTRERTNYYAEVYKRIFEGISAKSVIDLGAGINGFTYEKFPAGIDYVAIEGIKQLVDLMQRYFDGEKIGEAKALHHSLFEKEKILEIIGNQKSPRVVLMFKVIDSLEMLQRDYSLELLRDLMRKAKVERMCVSFATKSFEKRSRFKAQRGWLVKFIEENFKMLDDFELGGERYIVFENKGK